MKDNISVCFFPTQTIFIDDCKDFLNSITLNLNHEVQKYSFFSNVFQAIEYIEKKSMLSFWYEQYFTNLEEEKADRKLLEIDLSGIQKQAFNPQRQEIITSIVIDYDMPEINGLEVCKKLAHLPIQKILLTGAADEKLAVEAFNSGLINCFIGKHNQNIYEMLNNKIKQISFEYFKSISDLFTKHEMDYKVGFINSELNKFWNSYILNKNIVEYYILETHSLYLLVDKEEKINILGFYSLNELNKLDEYSLSYDKSRNNHLAKDSDSLVFIPAKIDFLKNTQYHNGFLVKKEIINFNNEPYYYFYLQNI